MPQRIELILSKKDKGETMCRGILGNLLERGLYSRAGISKPDVRHCNASMFGSGRRSPVSMVLWKVLVVCHGFVDELVVSTNCPTQDMTALPGVFVQHCIFGS